MEMPKQLRNWVLFLCFLTACFVLVGCAPQARWPQRICPGKDSKAEALSILTERSQNLMSLEAKGRCIWKHFTEGKKSGKESFAIKVWINPPSQIRLHGDVAFNARGLDLGANDDEFWLAIKPEHDSYYWGNWSDANLLGDVMLSPQLMLEAFGAGRIEDEQAWSLSSEKGFDRLSKLSNGREIEKIYIYNCDQVVSKIEYLNDNGQVIVEVGLGKYKKVKDGFLAPTSIKIVSPTQGEEINIFDIKLNSIKPKEFTREHLNILFNRPPAKRYKNVYKNIDGNWVEQIE